MTPVLAVPVWTELDPGFAYRLPDTHARLQEGGLVVHPDVVKVVLHGSRGLAGGCRPDSDIDLSLVVDAPPMARSALGPLPWSPTCRGRARTITTTRNRVLTDAGCELAYEDYLAVWTQTFDEAERVASASLDEFSMDQVCARFLAAALPGGAGGCLLGEFRDAYLEEWSRGVTPIALLGEMLEELASRCTLALVSNTHHAPLVHGLLQRVGLAGSFAAVVTSVEHGRRKPCRTIYEHALALTAGAPGEALFVGDSFGPDYVGPRAVGMRALLIDPEGRAPMPAADRLASALELRERVGG